MTEDRPARTNPDFIFATSGASDARPTLQVVARKRAWQVALQSLGIDLAVALALLVMQNVEKLSTGAALAAFGLLLAKTAASTVAAWVIRRFVDRSGFNPDGTPKPIS